MSNQKVCVVVPVHNRLELTIRFIENFSQSSYKNYTIVIVDDGSTDGTSEYIAKNHPNIILLYTKDDLWWSGSTNLGVKYAIEHEFDCVLTINQDSSVDSELLLNLLKTAETHPDSIIGARVMIGHTDKVWATGVLVCFSMFPFLRLNNCNKDFDDLDSATKNADILETKALAGNGVLVPVSVFKKIGFYDAIWCPQYHGDTEFTYRATKSGIKCYVDMNAIVYNNEFVANPKFSILDGLFSRKSPHYWRPIAKFYFVDAPLKYKIFFFKQFLWIPKQIVKKMLGR